MPRKTWAVVVMPPERRTAIVEELRSIGIDVWAAANCQEARWLLEKNTPTPIEIVISDLSLSDGNWCDVFKQLVNTGLHAAMVVVAPNADERLWSEVLWRGAHDLLVEPYDSGDLRRMVEGAMRALRGSSMRAMSPEPNDTLAPEPTRLVAS